MKPTSLCLDTFSWPGPAGQVGRAAGPKVTHRQLSGEAWCVVWTRTAGWATRCSARCCLWRCEWTAGARARSWSWTGGPGRTGHTSPGPPVCCGNTGLRWAGALLANPQEAVHRVATTSNNDEGQVIKFVLALTEPCVNLKIQ